jgi:hypothetical protein
MIGSQHKKNSPARVDWGLHDDTTGDDICKPTSTANTDGWQEDNAMCQRCKWHFKRHSGTTPECAEELHEQLPQVLGRPTTSTIQTPKKETSTTISSKN